MKTSQRTYSGTSTVHDNIPIAKANKVSLIDSAYTSTILFVYIAHSETTEVNELIIAFEYWVKELTDHQRPVPDSPTLNADNTLDYLDFDLHTLE